jgi:hypothetical protein
VRRATQDYICAHAYDFPSVLQRFLPFFFGAMSYEQGVFVPFITYLFLQLSPQICYVTIDLQFNH